MVAGISALLIFTVPSTLVVGSLLATALVSAVTFWAIFRRGDDRERFEAVFGRHGHGRQHPRADRDALLPRRRGRFQLVVMGAPRRMERNAGPLEPSDGRWMVTPAALAAGVQHDVEVTDVVDKVEQHRALPPQQGGYAGQTRIDASPTMIATVFAQRRQTDSCT